MDRLHPPTKMDRFHPLVISYIIVLFYIISLSATSTVADEERKVYIVYLGALPEKEYLPSVHHTRILEEVVDWRYVEQSLIRSYNRSFNGFAAYLTNQEQQKLAARDDVALVIPSKVLQPQTTASWDFMGFSENVHRNHKIESDIIIGVIDTGIWPESKSFSDHGFGPIPKKWKGACKGGKNFTCNKKIVGARYYVSGDDSARDIEGHGSHTASTAAGNKVKNVSFYGIAQGTARGGVPSARIAVYKVCSRMGCADADILAGFDDAVADGVDIITISIGSEFPVDLKNDIIAIASFHALQKGVLTVHSAGNYGFTSGGISSTAPWLFTVAGSTTNRKIITKVVLGDEMTIAGSAVNSFKLNGTKFPLILGKDASKHCTNIGAMACFPGCLDKDLVKGKIVVCDSSFGIITAKSAGGLGSITLSNAFLSDVSFVVPYSASALSPQQFKLVESYINSAKKPQANILTSETIKDFTAPIVASFSSRGPNSIFPDILKPDISAPGVDILAAFSPGSSPSGFPKLDTRSVGYNILSGTSMACPHVTAAAAYVKSLHPHWSPSVIKSALMTTAWRMNATNASYKDAEFSYGAGHLDPVKAAHPGLVYKTSKADYIKMICGLKIDSSTLRKIFADNSTCRKVIPIQAKDLNYPTMTAQVQEQKEFRVTFRRRVTNVGVPNSTYRASITKTSLGNISVKPDMLHFKSLNQRKSFIVTVTGKSVKQNISASLEWLDGIHTVRSPIVIYT